MTALHNSVATKYPAVQNYIGGQFVAGDAVGAPKPAFPAWAPEREFANGNIVNDFAPQ